MIRCVTVIFIFISTAASFAQPLRKKDVIGNYRRNSDDRFKLMSKEELDKLYGMRYEQSIEKLRLHRNGKFTIAYEGRLKVMISKRKPYLTIGKWRLESDSVILSYPLRTEDVTTYYDVLYYLVGQCYLKPLNDKLGYSRIDPQCEW